MANRCPYCGETAISASRKFALGPGGRTPCRKCGKNVSVPWWSVAAIVPSVTLTFILITASSLTLALVGVALFILVSTLYVRSVPLEPRD